MLKSPSGGTSTHVPVGYLQSLNQKFIAHFLTFLAKYSPLFAIWSVASTPRSSSTSPTAFLLDVAFITSSRSRSNAFLWLRRSFSNCTFCLANSSSAYWRFLSLVSNSSSISSFNWAQPSWVSVICFFHCFCTSAKSTSISVKYSWDLSESSSHFFFQSCCAVPNDLSSSSSIVFRHCPALDCTSCFDISSSLDFCWDSFAFRGSSAFSRRTTKRVKARCFVAIVESNGRRFFFFIPVTSSWAFFL